MHSSLTAAGTWMVALSDHFTFIMQMQTAEARSIPRRNVPTPVPAMTGPQSVKEEKANVSLSNAQCVCEHVGIHVASSQEELVSFLRYAIASCNCFWAVVNCPYVWRQFEGVWSTRAAL